MCLRIVQQSNICIHQSGVMYPRVRDFFYCKFNTYSVIMGNVVLIVTKGRSCSSCIFIRPVQSWLLGPNQRSTQLSRYEFEPNQRSNQIFGSKFKLLPYQRFYQISWFNLKPNQRSSQIPGFTFVPNQSLNQIVCKIILGFNHRDEYSHIEKKLRLKL